MEYALRLLSRRALSAGDLRVRLVRRALDPADVEQAMSRLSESGLLNDDRFAESYAAARLENQGFGKMRVLRDLRQRRVAPEIAERAVQETFRDTDEGNLVEEFLSRKYRGKNLPRFLSEEKNLLAAYRRLRFAGFSSAVSIGVLKRYAAQAESLEAVEEGLEDREE